MDNIEKPKSVNIENKNSSQFFQNQSDLKILLSDLENELQLLPFLILILDEKGFCLQALITNLKYFPELPAYYSGKNLSKIFTFDLLQSFQESIKNLDDNNKLLTLEFSKKIDNEEIWCGGNIISLRSNRYLMIIQDITPWKKRQFELQKAKALAEATNTAKTNFIASVSHELRTPLNAIQGYTQILELENTLTEKQRNFLKTIKNSGDHLLNLINEILDISRIEAQREKLQLHEFNLYALIHEVLSTVQIKAKSKGLILKFIETTPLSNMVKGDQKKIKQILYNLLINSVKFTENGDIILRVSSTEIISSDRNKTLITDKCFIRLEVEDTGVGISEDKIEKIFEPFTHEDIKGQSIEGIGLGLPITKKLLDLMGGNISVQSELGKGSIFTVEFELELVKEKSKHSLKKNLHHQSIKGNLKKILIADDNEDNLLMLSSFLESFNFNISIAKNGKRTMESAQQEVPDLILLDFLMPDMDGLQVLTSIKNNSPLNTPKIIGITAAVTDKPNVGEFAKKCDSFISKPIDLNHLLEEIKKVLNFNENNEYDRPEKKLNGDKAVIQYCIPPVTAINHIKLLIDQGDYVELENTIHQFEQEGNYQKFNDKINGFIKTYNEKGLLSYLSTLSSGNE